MKILPKKCLRERISKSKIILYKTDLYIPSGININKCKQGTDFPESRNNFLHLLSLRVRFEISKKIKKVQNINVSISAQLMLINVRPFVSVLRSETERVSIDYI